jgi:hypothetical protein
MTQLYLAAFAATLAFSAALAAAPAADEPKDTDRSEPPGAAVEVKINVKKDKLTLDLGGKTSEEFKKMIEEAAKSGKYPDAAAVDLEIEFKNSSDKDVSIQFAGDSNQLTLDVKGPGVVNAETQRAFTREFRIPKPITLAPGKSHTIELKALKYGFRGVARSTFLTEPGEISITAVYQTAVSPAPKDAKDAGDNFGAVKLISAPVKFKVEEKK